MKQSLFLVVIGVSISLLSMCSEDRQPIRYPDPLAELFWGKNVKMMLGHNLEVPSLIDTTVFDSVGNIVEIRRFWHKEKRAFDSLRFINRKLVESEEFKNYVITYEYGEDFILQKWNRLKHFEWEFTTDDINHKDYFVVRFELNHGTIERELDPENGVYTMYFYDNKKRLLRKEIRSLENDEQAQKWEYFYENGTLVKINYFIGEELSRRYFCSKEGMLDSAIFLPDTRLRYEYVMP